MGTFEKWVRLNGGYLWTVDTSEQRVRLNILNHMVILNVFEKPPLLRRGKITRLSCHRECSPLAPFVWVWWGCSLFWGITINLVAVTRKPTVFYRSILRKLPIHCWRGEFLSNYEGDNHNQWSVVLRNNLVTWGAPWNKEEGWGGGPLKGNNVVLLWWNHIIFCGYVICKEGIQ